MPVNVPNDDINYIQNGEPLSGTNDQYVGDGPLNRAILEVRENQEVIESFVNSVETKAKGTSQKVTSSDFVASGGEILYINQMQEVTIELDSSGINDGEGIRLIVGSDLDDYPVVLSPISGDTVDNVTGAVYLDDNAIGMVFLTYDKDEQNWVVTTMPSGISGADWHTQQKRIFAL